MPFLSVEGCSGVDGPPVGQCNQAQARIFVDESDHGVAQPTAALFGRKRRDDLVIAEKCHASPGGDLPAGQARSLRKQAHGGRVGVGVGVAENDHIVGAGRARVTESAAFVIAERLRRSAAIAAVDISRSGHRVKPADLGVEIEVPAATLVDLAASECNCSE